MQLRKLFLTSLAISSLSIANTYAQEEDQAAGGEFDLEKVSCWDVMTLSDEDMSHTLVMLYGYNAGKHDQSAHTSETVENVITKAGEICAENPDMFAYQAFANPEE